MIYTITANPAIDYYLHLEHLRIGQVNFSNGEHLVAGGKGINVSSMLDILGVDNVAIALVAGQTGRILESMAKERGLNTAFIHLESGSTRINVKITSKESTSINGTGPCLDKSVIPAILNKLETVSQEDIVVISGSLPKSAPRALYVELVQALGKLKAQVVIDTGGSLLRTLLSFRPLLIKPNIDELEEYFARPVTESADIVQCARHLQHSGARNVLISRGSEGSVFLAEDGQAFIGNCPGGPIVNTVGCGDSMVAGFLAGYVRTSDARDAYRLSIAAGCAKAVCVGEVTLEAVQRMCTQVELVSVENPCNVQGTEFGNT